MVPAKIDLDNMGNYHALHGNIKISDKDIDDAYTFEGLHPKFLKWYDNCPDLRYVVNANAYHIQQLGFAMQNANKWLGNDLEIHNNSVLEGNHRLRAVQWLKNKGITIKVPYIIL